MYNFDKWIMKSRTIWGIIMAAVPTVRPLLSLVGIDLPPEFERDADTAFNSVLSSIEAISGTLGIIVATWGRWMAGGVFFVKPKKGNTSA